MNREQPVSTIEAILAELKAHATQRGDTVLQGLVRRLEDALAGERTAGDRTTVGDITGSKGIAIGRQAQAYVTESSVAVNLAQVFGTISEKLEALPQTKPAVTARDVQDARDELEQMKPEVLKGEQADEGFLSRRFRNLARTGPDILDVVTATLLNPAAGVAQVVRKIARKARDDAGLAPAA